ncbi:MAG: hypothetical protein AAGJ18_22995 [Bacteroidota bacterium]
MSYRHFSTENKKRTLGKPLSYRREKAVTGKVGAIVLTKQLAETIAHLPADLGESFKLFMTGHKVEEIADRMCVPVISVMRNIDFARIEIRDLVGHQYGNHPFRRA